MNGRVFLDTNILVYAFTDNEEKCKTARQLLDESEASFVVSTQVLSEFYNAMAKNKVEHQRIVASVTEIAEFCEINSVGYQTVKGAYQTKERYGFSYWDSLILSSALENGCSQVYSEDMHDGQVINDALKIVNVLK